VVVVAALPTIEDALDELGIVLPRSRKLSCPKGGDSDPSLHVYDDSFYCFHCGRHGDGLGLLAFFYDRDPSDLLRERGGSGRYQYSPYRRTDATKHLRRGQVARSVYNLFRDAHTDWFRRLHRLYVDAPLWAFEQALDVYSIVFDDVADRILGHGVYADDGALSPQQAEELVVELRGWFDQWVRSESDRVGQVVAAERRNRYRMLRRARVKGEVYEQR